jgi:hypothetical protein
MVRIEPGTGVQQMLWPTVVAGAGIEPATYGL